MKVMKVQERETGLIPDVVSVQMLKWRLVGLDVF